MKIPRPRTLIILGVLLLVPVVAVVVLKRRNAPLPHDQAYALGMKELEAGRFREAFSYFAHAARLRPEDTRYQFGAAQAAVKLGNQTSASEHAGEAWSRGLKNKEVFQIRCSTLTGDRAARLRKGLEWLRELPDNRERRELEGDLYQSAGDLATCLRIWTELHVASPGPALANKIALARVGAGEPQKAHEFLQACRTAGGLDEEGFGLLASLAAYRDDAQEAAAVLADGLARFDTSESLRLNRGVFLIWQDRLAEAATALDPLKGRSPDPAREALHGQARLFLGFLCAAQADPAGLVALTSLAAGEGPTFEGERLYYQGLKERSVETLKQARLLLKAQPACDWALARELARAGAWKESSELYRGITGLLAWAPVLQIEWAHVQARTGKAEEAFASLRRIHGRKYFSRSSLELFRDLALAKGLNKEAAEAQAQLEKRFRDDPSVALAGGVLALRSGQLSEASAILDSLSEKNPGRDDVETAKLSLLFARKDYAGVLKAAETSKAPAEAVAPIKAGALVMLGRTDEASAVYEKALAGSRNPWTLVSYANLLLRLDKVDLAGARYAEALALLPKNLTARLGLATVALRKRDLKAAREHAEAAAQTTSLAYPHVLLAEIEMEEGRPDRALASCNRALGFSSKDERATFLLGVANLDLGRYDEAEAALLRCVAMRPEATAYQWQLARVRMARGALGEALAVVDGALSRGGAVDVSFQSLRLVLLARMGRAADAREQFTRMAPNLPPERAVLCDAWLLQQEGRTAEAVERLRGRLDDPHVAFAWAELTIMDGTSAGVLEALERHALDAPRWGRLGELARQKGLLPAAAACYRRALRHDPDNPQLLNNFAFASLQLESFNETDVLAAAKKVSSMQPGNPSLVHTYATALLRCRKERECVELLEKSPALTQRHARLLMVLAQAQERLGQWGPALKSYEACLAHADTEGVKSGELSRSNVRQRVEFVKSRMETR